MTHAPLYVAVELTESTTAEQASVLARTLADMYPRGITKITVGSYEVYDEFAVQATSTP